MKRLLALATLAGAAAVARRYLAVRDALAQVPAELRSPLLPLLTGSTTTRSLPRSRLINRIKTPSGPGVMVTSRKIPGRPPVTVFVTAPTEPRPLRPGLLYIHGGGMIMGSPQMEALGSGTVARELEAVTVSPEYRLAPEHPFPAALDDCMATLTWMRENAAELGIDPDRIAVIGSSAGGGLAAAVAQRAHDEGIRLRAQVLVYPMIDDRTALRDDHGGRGAFLWTPQSNLFGWTAYLGRAPRLSDAPPYAAPARRTDLSGLAPAWIGVGSLDLFHDESVAYAKALQDCGVACELVTVPGMYHGADGLARNAPAMKEFRRRTLDYLRSYL
ncbi:alpha/beta hydrolase [Mycobacterium sp.]|uniref:alpha/beta hydrolase n=1 Tax=Mycobacterium sp. TaxID=1785 RepID=UPI002CE31D4A|nr:alpha/beta hydrolase [Mycobacterium sp.]HTQ16016.1 alpha/beta hydrolase [Mycobacterium sp.]